MNMRELIDLFEAPAQGVTGQKLAQTSGGQFMNRSDRLNQAKVDAALGGAINPATGKPYVAGTAAANQALAKKFSQPAAVAAAPAPTANVPASSADNEALKGRTIANAMNPPAAAANPGTAAAGVAFNQAAGSSTGTTATSTVPANQALDAGEEIVNAPAADTRGAAAMASRSAPAAQELPANAFPDPNAAANTIPAQQNTAAPATAATNNPASKVDYQPVTGGFGQSTNVVSRTADKIAADAKAGPGGPNPATKSYASFGDFASAVGDKVKGLFGGNKTAAPDTSNAAAAMASKSATPPSQPEVFGEEELEEENNMELEEMMRLSGLALNEKAPPGAKAERTVKHIKKGYAKDGKLTKKEKGIAYATAWKQHNKEKVNEGMDIMLDEDGQTLKHIVNRFKHETKNFMNSGFMAENLFDALFDYYLDRGDMPYGIAKAREGDPYQWVEERFYADMGSEMSEGAVAEQTVDPLSELARLAGLREDGPGASRVYNQKSIGAGKTQPYRDSDNTSYDSAGNPKTKDITRMSSKEYYQGHPHGVPYDEWKRSYAEKGIDLDKMDGTNEDLMSSLKSGAKTVQRAIDKATLPKGMHAEYDRLQAQKDEREFQQSGSAYRDKAGAVYDREGNPKTMAGISAKDYLDPKPNRDRDLYSMATGAKSAAASDKPDLPSYPGNLKECGDMPTGHDNMNQKNRLNVTTNMSSDGTKDVTINAQGDKADSLLQMLKMAGMRPYDDHEQSRMAEPEIIMVSSEPQDVMMDEERETDYANTPEEEYQTVDSILRQGNDLNREKRQYRKEYPGDNPMAESLLDADLNAVLESILLRDDNNGPDIKRNPDTGRVSATYPAPKKPDQSELPLPKEPFHGPRSLKVDGEKTGTEKEVDEGWEDVSNFVGDIVGTEASKLRGSQQLRDLDAMRKQYKGTEYEKQVNDRYTTHLDRLQGDKGEVVGKDGEPIKVLPPQQWKGGK